MKHVLDYFGNYIKLPSIGNKILRDGYTFSVSEVIINNDICIIASITLRGQGGEIEIGYYDYCNLRTSFNV